MAQGKSRLYRSVLLFFTLFQGFGAVLGGTMGMIYPLGDWYGGQAMVPRLQVLPFSDVLFQNLFVPACMLAVLIGVGNLVAAVLILRHVDAGAWIGCVEGLIIACFTTVELAVLGSNPISQVYFVLGMVQFLFGVLYLHALRLF